VIGQIEGGIVQGVGLAVMEEIVVDGGLVLNPSFTDYLIPTIADAPQVLATCIEEPEPGAPFGAKGVGEPPTISSTAAVAAAIRDATGRDVTRVPVRPWDLVEPHPMAPWMAPPRTADGPAGRGVASASEQPQSAEAQEAPEWTDVSVRDAVLDAGDDRRDRQRDAGGDERPRT
jgi:hypothetical protein